MNAHPIASENSKQRLTEFSTGHRIAGLVALAVVALFGTVQWMQAGHEQTGDAQNEGRAVPPPTPVEYYPTQVPN